VWSKPIGEGMDKPKTLACPELSDALGKEKNSKAEVLIVKPPRLRVVNTLVLFFARRNLMTD
jgi:hypothetical protein